jgi:hypothetical protein
MTNVNLELVNFITKTNNITGCSFATIKNYVNKYGEVANHRVNLGATLSGAKAKDLVTIKNANVTELFKQFMPNANVISHLDENNNVVYTKDYATFLKAFNELHDSFVVVGDKNIDGTIKVRNNRSFGQINAYTVINPSVKVHNEKERLYIYALRLSKEVLQYGEYPTTNKHAKTICKDFIKKTLDFKSNKFTMFIVEKADVMNLAKTSFNGENLAINL